MSRKRIAVLTMTAEPRLMLSGVEDSQVHIVKCDQLDRSLFSLKAHLPEKLEKLKAAGFILLVDEVLPCFSKYGRGVRLSNLDPKGRPIVVSAMEAYKSLSTLGGITYPQNAGGQFEISPSLVNEQRDLKGQVTYQIDWSELRPETYALLLTIYAATQDSLADNATMLSLLERLAEGRKASVFDRASNLFQKRDQLIADGVKRGGE